MIFIKKFSALRVKMIPRCNSFEKSRVSSAGGGGGGARHDHFFVDTGSQPIALYIKQNVRLQGQICPDKSQLEQIQMANSETLIKFLYLHAVCVFSIYFFHIHVMTKVGNQLFNSFIDFISFKHIYTG